MKMILPKPNVKTTNREQEAREQKDYFFYSY